MLECQLRSRPESGQQQLLFYAGKQAPFSESSERVSLFRNCSLIIVVATPLPFLCSHLPLLCTRLQFHIAVAGDNICCGRWYGTWNAGPSDYTTPAVSLLFSAILCFLPSFCTDLLWCVFYLFVV